MVRRLFDRVKADDGAALVLIAVSMMLLIGMAAIAVDLGALRSDIRSERLAADAAATAGVAESSPISGIDAQKACEVAWDYLLLNLDDEGASVTPPNCAQLVPPPPGGACTPDVAREAEATAGPYSFVITYPVPDGDLLMGSQAISTPIDGVPCQRLGVSIQRTRDSWFARVLGFASNSTSVSAVARYAAGAGGGEVVPLLVLEPISCDALYTSGQGKVTVSFLPPDTPGFIVVDSDGSKTTNPNACIGAQNWTIDSKGNQNGWIRAIPTPPPTNIPSAILSYALSGAPGANPARSYDPGDLTSPVDPLDISDLLEPPFTWFRLYPKPSFVSQRITRAAIDHRYDCKATYPDYPLDLGNPGLGGIPISPCLDAPAPYIEQLRAPSAYGGMVGTSPVGISQRWTDSYPCAVAADITVSGDWWVDCPGGLIIGSSYTVIFDGGDVVFDGDIDVRSSGTLRVNPSPSSDQIVFVRGTPADPGHLLKGAQTTVSLDQTFVLLQYGKLDLVGGPLGDLDWIAPLAGNFEDLALWSEAPLAHQIGGQAGNTLTGTFFTPLSDPFTLTGGSTQFQTDAQFVTRRLEVKGQGEVKMHPDPDRTTLIPIREVRLIR